MEKIVDWIMLMNRTKRNAFLRDSLNCCFVNDIRMYISHMHRNVDEVRSHIYNAI